MTSKILDKCIIPSFKKRLDIKHTKEFKDSNKPWNDLGLNQMKNVGSTMFLIKQSNAQSLSEWEQYYFSSGRERRNIISQTTGSISYALNTKYGRTQKEFIDFARILSEATGIPIQNALIYVYIRVIDETWVGYEKELAALKQIQAFLFKHKKEYLINKADSFTDSNYAVDFELKQNGKIVLGVQLKPVSYKNSQNSGVIDIKPENKIKNDKYTKEYGAKVLYLYYDRTTITNFNEFENFFKTQ